MRAISSSCLTVSGVDLTHLALIYYFSLFNWFYFSSFSFFCLSKLSSHSFCFCFMASISSTLAWIFHSSCCLSQFPSIYYQHLTCVGSSSGPNLVPNSENHYWILSLFFILKWLLRTKAADFYPSLSSSGSILSLIWTYVYPIHLLPSILSNEFSVVTSIHQTKSIPHSLILRSTTLEAVPLTSRSYYLIFLANLFVANISWGSTFPIALHREMACS